MKPHFSEDEYSSIIIHEHINKYPDTIFYKPTPKAEKKLGYDDALSKEKGWPLFCQFKVSEYLNGGGKEYALMGGPYFRFHTYEDEPEGNSFGNQYNVLRRLSLAIRRPSVFYVAPLFYKRAVLDECRRRNITIENSRFIDLAALKNLDTSKIHSICYDKSGKVVICSEPMIIEKGSFGWSVERLGQPMTYSDFANVIVEHSQSILGGDFAPSEDSFETLHHFLKEMDQRGSKFLWIKDK